MNKKEFLKTLHNSLGNISEKEKKDILYDYEEHFQVGIEKGKSEEKIIHELGDPKKIAKSHIVSHALERAQKNPTSSNVLKAIFAAITLGFFNIIILGPVLGLFAVLLALFFTSIAVILSGIAGILGVIPIPFIHSDIFAVIGIHPAAIIFMSIGTIALGFLFLIGIVYITKYFYKIIVKYIKWNINIIKNKERGLKSYV